MKTVLKNQIKKFQISLQEERFWDAHEDLELLWFPRRFERSTEVKILKGFINAAVSFELHKRGRREQSQRVWSNYLKYRQLLLQAKKENINHFYQLSREVESIKKEL